MTLEQKLQSITHDAVVWLCMKYWRAATNAADRQAATTRIVEILTTIPNQIKRDTYVKTVADESARLNEIPARELAELKKEYSKLNRESTAEKAEDRRKVMLERMRELEQRSADLEGEVKPVLAAKDLLKYVKEAVAEKERERKAKVRNLEVDQSMMDGSEDDARDPWQNCPSWMNSEQVKEKGFCLVDQKAYNGKPKRYGIYTFNPESRSHSEITNFTFEPIFHNYKAENSRYILEIDNGYKRAVIDIDAQTLVSPDKMLTRLAGEGNFMIYGSKNSYLRVASDLLQNFRRCIEITAFGWQPYGFYAYIDRIFIPGTGLVPVDEWGVCVHEKESYLLPPSSAAVRALRRTADDPYEHDRVLSFYQSPISLNSWVKKMVRVYAEKGLTGVAYAFMCAFRDIVFDVDANFPHLYGVGEASSGKSKWGASVGFFFFHKRQAFNLNSGTDFAFNRYVCQFVNTVALLNEFDEKAVREEWFQQIKGFYDGEGRQRGSMQTKGKIETMKVQSGVLLMGQYLVTKDDNSVVTRCIIEQFSKKERTQEDANAYEELQALQDQGLTSLVTEVLPLRAQFKAKYKERFNKFLSEWRALYNDRAKTKENFRGNFNQRIVQNWCHLYTAMDLVSRELGLEVRLGDFENYCFENAAYWCRFIRSSDTLSEFWNTMSYLVDKHVLRDRWDFRIETLTSITLSGESGDPVVRTFTEPTKVLFLRMNTIHKEYQMAYKQRTGNTGMNAETLTQYFKSRAYYIGHVRNYRFSDGKSVKITSCFAFRYDDIGLDIDPEQEAGWTVPPQTDEKPF